MQAGDGARAATREGRGHEARRGAQDHDTGNEVPQPQFFDAAEAASGRAATPIEAGSQQLSVDVSVTFAVMS